MIIPHDIDVDLRPDRRPFAVGYVIFVKVEASGEIRLRGVPQLSAIVGNADRTIASPTDWDGALYNQRVAVRICIIGQNVEQIVGTACIDDKVIIARDWG